MGISSPLVDLQNQYDLLQKEYEYEKHTDSNPSVRVCENEWRRASVGIRSLRDAVIITP